MKLKKLLVLLLCAALVLGISGCGKDRGPEESDDTPSQIEDPNYPVAIGDIRVSERPMEIVSLSPSLTEVICELGARTRIVGVSDYCDYPDMVSELSRCGTAAMPDLAAIEKLRPQIVVSSSALTQADTVRLQQMDIEVIVLRRANSIEKLREIYETLGTVLDGMEDGHANGQAVFDELEARYDAIVSKAAAVSNPYSGIMLRATPLMAATGDSFEGRLLEAIGVINDAAQFTGWEYPADKAVDLYPDVIFYDVSIDPAYFGTTLVYSTTDAYKQERMYPYNSLLLERQSARMFDELENMFAAVYPTAA